MFDVTSVFKEHVFRFHIALCEFARLYGEIVLASQWRHNELDGVSIHQPHDCLLNRSFRRRSYKTSKLRVTALFEGNSPETGEFPAQRASNAENVSIWWRHHRNEHTLINGAILHASSSQHITKLQFCFECSLSNWIFLYMWNSIGSSNVNASITINHSTDIPSTIVQRWNLWPLWLLGIWS